MTRQVQKFARGALWLLPVWAALLFLATLTEQPDPTTAFAEFADYVTTGRFLLSHLVGSIVGAAIGSIGVIGLMVYLQDSKAAGRAVAGMVATVVGNVLMASTYGAAAFAQPAMGRLFQAGQANAQEFYTQVYAVPLFVTALAGLLLFLVGGLFSGSAIAGSGRLPRWAGWVYALAATGFALGLFFPPIVMNVTSILLILATLAVAWSGRGEPARGGVRVGVAPEA
jgi:hypothetical protein